MEESSLMDPSSNQDKSEHETPITAKETTEQEVKTLVSPLPFSAAPEEEWGPIPDEIIQGVPATYSPWSVIALILGILTLLLMMTSGFLGYQYYQNIQQSARNMDDLIQELEPLHNKVENFTGTMTKLQEDILGNLKIQIGKLFDILKRQKMNQGNYLESCPKHWKHYKDNCYYQTLKATSWFNCSHFCDSMNSTFLPTGDDTLIDFMKTLKLKDTWIGISYQQDSNEWKWVDGSSYPFRASPKPEDDLQDLCVYIKLHTLDSYQCNRTLPCMCEKILSDEK